MAESRDRFRLREAVKHVEGQSSFIQQPVVKQRIALPTLAKSQGPMTQYQLGTFDVYKNNPSELTVGDLKRQAYAMCRLEGEQDVLLHRCQGEQSGGFWIAVPCGAVSVDTSNLKFCDLFEDDEAPAQWTLTFDGITTENREVPRPIAGPGLNYAWMSLADRTDFIAELNSAHTLNYAGPCVWQKQANVVVTSTDTIEYGIQLRAAGLVDFRLFDSDDPITETQMVLQIGGTGVDGDNLAMLSVNESMFVEDQQTWRTDRNGQKYDTRLAVRDYLSIADFQHLSGLGPFPPILRRFRNIITDGAHFSLSPV